MATITRTALTTTSVTLKITGLTGSSYTTMYMKVNGVQKTVTKSGTESTTATFTGLTAGTSYSAYFYIKSSGGSVGEGNVNVYTKPNSVTGISVGSITSTSASVSWSISGSKSGFRVAVRQGTSSSGTLVKEYTPTSTSQSITGLSAGTTYYVGIVARNANGDESVSSSTTFTTTYAVPSTPTISSVSSTDSSVTAVWGSASNATSYSVKLYNSNGSLINTVSTTNTSYTFSGLTAGTFYSVAVSSANSGATSSNSSQRSIETKPSAMGTIGVSTTGSTMTGSWSNFSAYRFRVVLRKGSSSSGTLVSEVYTYDSYYTFTGLTENTQYYFGVEPINSSGVTGVSGNNTAYTKVSPPSNLKVSSKTKSSFTVTFTGVSSASSYILRAYHSATGSLINTVTSTSTTMTIGSLNEFVSYRLVLTARNASNAESTTITVTDTTKDETPPTVAISSSSSDGAMKINWSATDTGSGMRETSRFAVAITSNGGTTYVHKDYTDNYYYSFISDANGDEFVDGGKYYMRVTAYDAQGNNASTTSGQLTFKRSRPNDWDWQVAKTKGGTVVVTANEWNSLCTRINQFRQYKKFDNYSFTEAVKGTNITATMFNQARSAIASMNTTGLPSTVSKGTSLTASQFNSLTSTLNAIT